MGSLSVNKLIQIAAAVGQAMGRKAGQSKFTAQPDELFLLARLTTSDSEYRISVDHDVQQGIWAGTKGLAWRNEFYATAMSVGILPAKVASGVTYFGAQPPVYFPDPNIFNQAATSVLTEAQALEGIYLGSHTFQTNESIRIDQVKTLKYRHAQTTQAAPVIQTGFSGTTASYSLQNEETGDQFKYLGNNMKLVGGDDNYISFNLQCADKTNIVGNSGGTRVNYLCVRLLGFVVKGGGTTTLRKG